MTNFILRRFVYMVVVVLGVSIFVFSISRVAGDPRLILIDEYTSKASWDAWGEAMGLDKPLVVQYGIWLGNAVRGDFGKSLYHRVNSLDIIRARVRATLELAAGGFIVAAVLGIPLGVLSAVKRGTPVDYLGRTIALFGQALPPFWLGIVLILIFSVQLGWLPTHGRGGIEHFILPSITLGWLPAAGFLRLIRSAMLDVLDSEYIKLARAKGVTNKAVIWKHAFRNAALAPLTYAGLLMGGLITGTVLTESVFAWPGLGRLAVQSVYGNDFPLMTGLMLLGTIVYTGMNFLTDLLYAYVDPRIRYA